MGKQSQPGIGYQQQHQMQGPEGHRRQINTGSDKPGIGIFRQQSGQRPDKKQNTTRQKTKNSTGNRAMAQWPQTEPVPTREIALGHR